MLFKAIKEQKENKPKTWQKIADFVLRDPAAATTLKLKEFSERVGVSEGSVVNFARSLGYEGYIELKVAIAQESSSFSGRYHTAASDATVFEKIVCSAKSSLDETAGVLDGAEVERLAALLVHTRGRVLVCGRSTSGQIAEILAGYLMRLQIPAFFGDHRVAAASLTGEDVLIAVTYSGNTDEILDAVQIAKARGAHTACITAFPHAKIAKICDTCLVFSSVEAQEGEFPIVARLVQLAVCDALCSSIYTIKEAHK